METLTFDSDDLSVTEDFLSRAYAKMRIASGSPGANRARIRRAGIASVSVDELALDFEMAYSVTPLGRICLCTVHEGTVRDHGFQGVEDSFGPGDMVLFAPPDLPYTGRICHARYTITMLDPALLAQVAGGGEGSRPVRLTGHRPRSAAAARQLHRTIAHLRDTVLADPETADQPLIAATATQHLAASVLAAFPNTALDEPADERADARPAVLRRALAYIDDHADQPITVADIAAAAHVTVRALQYAFRRHLDTTPLAQLRRVRLAHAHHDLVAADPGEGATVTEIAARWGFHHPGRFASLYRDTYRRAPHETLAGG
ncbi:MULTISPECIES: helix-turn-helix transcriptional regulator [Streptomyces]|uniref:Helix-turn-helix transcriptional regulator n=2 Tax=Streptomyces TaxID=1883 RepID=A0ABS9JIM4_9ACTN|nr:MULTISPECIES: helix-turn-helix transcriptional regulator [Streptomyces]MCG0065367.1 helix-turn-helix transcriptional regulator [Streptomyces tricolor]MYU26958.1 helix-turn-helix domain-containing protein [Streptomyces sp. SID7810]OYP13520.1 AraC family transcriptional regulator [Streptomyces sp. FBKL.4005]CUW25791.1 HTH-type transcriptional activator RhaS [Streptomyces reticuli]